MSAACDAQSPPPAQPATTESPADTAAVSAPPVPVDAGAAAPTPRPASAFTVIARHDALGYPFSIALDDEDRALVTSRRRQQALYLLPVEQPESEGIPSLPVDTAPSTPVALGEQRYALPLPEKRVLVLLRYRPGPSNPFSAEGEPVTLDGRPLGLLPTPARLWTLLAEAPERSLRGLSPTDGTELESFDAGATPREIGRVYDTLYVTASAPAPAVGQLLLLPLTATGEAARAPSTVPTPVNPMQLFADPRDPKRAWMTGEGSTALYRVRLDEARVEPTPVELGVMPAALIFGEGGLIALDARGAIARFTFEKSGAATQQARRTLAPGATSLIAGDGVLFVLEPSALLALDPASLEERARLPLPSRAGRAKRRASDGAILLTLPEHQEIVVLRWEPA